ncbi:protein-tyrosine phosphatase family protein [Roseovarius sp. M141]|uniref:protein-tyrosine phosphatase family protein n=1 Tax=Roseovarius sp. M141 TaxID=2583806 RepID=UPI0020CC52F9|nr:protein-tyrosine phosphatase family protein [Roseovarius sp. M141]MCQ0093895.1 protein phosphatase [Roseovarius sp. M141]
MTGFVIHALPVLRGILAIAPMPGSGGEYAADLEHLKDWQPAMVVTMTTSAEMVAAGAGNLGQDVAFLGSRWAHVATPDYGVPDADAMHNWDRAEPIALSALRGGGRVLIHCKGGCGRSGMAALRLMIAAGDAPDAALARLRALRPGAVETSAQMRWARRGGAEATDAGGGIR